MFIDHCGRGSQTCSIAAMALAIFFLALLLRPAVGQTNFGGGSQNSNPSSDVNTRLFTGKYHPTCHIF